MISVIPSSHISTMTAAFSKTIPTQIKQPTFHGLLYPNFKYITNKPAYKTANRLIFNYPNITNGHIHSKCRKSFSFKKLRCVP